MKSGSIRIALFAAVVLASPALTFAGGQPNKVIRTMSKAEMQDRTGVSQNVNQGKGAGVSRKQVASRANSSPSPAVLRPSGVDTAFSK
jgi:hypothetical protein